MYGSESLVTNKDISFGYDGFLIGIEKTKRKIALGGKKTPNISINKLDVLNTLPTKRNALEKSINNRLADDEVTFVSHIVDTTLYPEKEHIYDLYGNLSKYSAQKKLGDKVYSDGRKALGTLKEKILERVKKVELTTNKYTHLILMSTGWNTTQEASVKAYNDWSKGIIETAPDNIYFRPLFITLSWPSVWLHNEKISPFSVKRKGNDADEVGLLSANYLVNNIMLDSRLKDLKKVLIGHSFGARLLSRSFFSKGLLNSSNTVEEEIDIFIGLQPAFSFKRFSPSKAGDRNGEGFPYRRLSEMKTKLFFTMSSKDEAGGFWANLLGKVAFPRDKFLMLGKSGWDEAESLSTENDLDKKVSNIQFITVNDEKCNLKIPMVHQPKNGEIIYVDASKCILGHTDVYNMKHGKLMNMFISY